MSKDFAVFILTHGRPDRVYTYKTLKRCGYTGEIYLIVDDEDETLPEYQRRFKNVVVFSKDEIAKEFDLGDNFKDKRAIIFARNASFKIAKELGIKYFIQLDDDYTEFAYRVDKNLDYNFSSIRNLDDVFEVMLKFYKKINALSIAMAQGGDFIGGKNSELAKSMALKRKCMNTFICSTDRSFKFVGRVNEDVNTYVSLGYIGKLFFTIPFFSINQLQTQSNKGGMTGLYLDNGTYLKTFYTIMYAPSCVKVSTMGNKYNRIHHKVLWNNAVPKIIREEVKNG